MPLLLDYYDDEQVARQHYIAFRNQVVRQLECDGAAACWHLTGAEIDAAMATITEDVVALPDGGRLSPTLPENWRTVSRPDRRVFQRNDRDHYIVLGDGGDEWWSSSAARATERIQPLSRIVRVPRIPTWNR